MNLFFGLPVPEKVIKTCLDVLQAAHPDWRSNQVIRWTELGHHHVTVHFFGPIPIETIGGLLAGLDDYLKKIDLKQLLINEINSFPKENSRLIAAQITLSSELADLHQVIETAVSDYQLPTERRSYRPHVTICRTNRANLLKTTPLSVSELAFEASELILYQSQQVAGKHHYVPLQCWGVKSRL